MRQAAARAEAFLARAQRPDGAFVPLWFGNQAAPEEENPVYGTGRVLAGLTAADRAWGLRDRCVADRAERWLLAAQHADGGWGGAPGVPPTLEETAVAVLACAERPARGGAADAAVARGLAWLAARTAGAEDFPASPIGLYFARLWYAERLYPVIFSAAAAGAAAGRTSS